MDTGTGIFLGIVVGSLVICITYFLTSENRREAEDDKVASNVVTLEEVQQLTGEIGRQISDGIRATLGLNMPSEVIEQGFVDDEPVKYHPLEYDPFMLQGLEEEWTPNSPQE